MYLHVGGDHLVAVRSVIVIFDWRARRAAATREFLDLQRSEGRLYDLSEGSPRSCIVAEQGTFLSAISPLTLLKRARTVLDDAHAVY